MKINVREGLLQEIEEYSSLGDDEWTAEKLQKVLSLLKEIIVAMNEGGVVALAEIDRLNRIMPHIGGTCKHNLIGDHIGASGECSVDTGAICGDECRNGKWVLKE